MAPTVKELRRMTEQEIIERHDQGIEHVQAGTTYWLDELAQRQADRHTRTMLRLTWVIAALTVTIGILTVVNVALVARG